MKKACLNIALIGVFSLSVKTVHGWPRLGYGANVVTQNSGDKALGLSVVVTSITATQIYSSTSKHREILFQNTSSTYSIHCGTFSSVTATSGMNRFILPPFPAAFTTNCTASWYCMGEAGAPSIEVVGEIELDSKD